MSLATSIATIRWCALNLGVFSPHSQVVIDARRAINSHLRLGGSVWVRQPEQFQ